MVKETEIWRSLQEQWEPGTDILMETKIWQALPQDLLLKIFYMLPVRVLAKMRTLSQEWKDRLSSDALQRIGANLWVHSFPGFLVQLESSTEGIAETWVIEYLGGDSSDMNIYKARFHGDAVIMDASRNIYCSHRKGDRSYLSIGNIATGARRDLPRPRGFDWWNFIVMDFNATRRRCTVLLGLNTIISRETDDRRMVMQIYDSESHEWTMVRMTVPKFMCPTGKGIYSKGKAYWIVSWDGTTRLIAFTIADEIWTEIGLPKGCGCDYLNKRFELGGCNGRVVLMVYSCACLCTRMWRLNEVPGAPEWCEPNMIWWPEGPMFFRAEANISGWTMMFNRELKISMCNPYRRVRRSITLPFPSSSPSRVFVSAFESNNVSWP